MDDKHAGEYERNILNSDENKFLDDISQTIIENIKRHDFFDPSFNPEAITVMILKTENFKKFCELKSKSEYDLENEKNQNSALLNYMRDNKESISGKKKKKPKRKSKSKKTKSNPKNNKEK